MRSPITTRNLSENSGLKRKKGKYFNSKTTSVATSHSSPQRSTSSSASSFRFKGLKITECVHNGKVQPRVYFPKGSPLKPSGGYRWYRSLDEAEQAVVEHEALQRRFGELARTVTVEELVEARSAKAWLEGTGISLVEAAQQVKAALESALESRTVIEGLDAYHAGIWEKFEDRKKQSLRTEPRHWRSVKQTIARLDQVKHLNLRALTGGKLRTCLSGLSKSSLKGHLRNLHAAFEFCIDAGWMDENPARDLRRFKADRPSKSRIIQTFTVEEVRAFLLAVAEEAPRAIPYFAICFFAGVRPEAAFKITWDDVGPNGYIYVPHTANKSGHAYNVKILPVLARWLDWWEAQGQIRAGLVVPFSTSTLKRIRKNAMTKAGMTRWRQDGTRKTFATAHRGTFKCKVLTSAALGHKGTTVLDEHYDSRLMTEEESEQYWQILPPDLHHPIDEEASQWDEK
ncbi:MAG: hypothetical protein JHC85_07640 [Chthoniobacterales bacterium]|nr:hypothetical protein [Chthoniobacterales bacterium]